MAAITSAVVVAAGSAYAANRKGAAAKKAANAQEAAAQQANQNASNIYQQSRADQMPYYEAGTNALNQLQRLNSGDYSSFTESPDFAYARDQMQKGIERGAAARGGLFNGGESVDLASALNGLASQNYGQFYNRLAGLAQGGQNAANSLAGLGQGYTNAYSQGMTNIGNAQAYAAQAKGDTQAGYANALASGIGAYFGAAGTGTGAQSATASSYGAFAPNVASYQSPNYTGYNGSTAFGAWGSNWLGGNK